MRTLKPCDYHDPSILARTSGVVAISTTQKSGFRIRRLLTTALGLLSLLAAGASSAYPLKFPAHGEDLPHGHYWRMSFIHAQSGNAYDLSGKRYDFDTGTWHNQKESGTGNDASIIFGQRLYAAADGEIVGCWREYPDWPGSNEYKANNHRQTIIGNHLSIRTDDGHLVSYGHLKNLSIPSSLCPNGSADGWLETMGPGESRPKTGSLWTEYVVPEGQRVQVRTGQFIGRVGHSGNSGGPHLHIQAEQITENGAGEIFQEGSVPIELTGALYQSVASPSYNDWQALNNDWLNDLFNAEGELAIWPDESPKISVSSRNSNQLDLFRTGSNRQLQHKTWNGSEWSAWTNLGGILTSSPSCTSWASNRIDCFARGQNLALYQKVWTSAGGWTGWIEKGGLLASAPSVTSRNVDHLDVFVRGMNNQLYQKVWTGSYWTSWISQGGELHSGPACVAPNWAQLECFARGPNRHLMHKAWTSPGGWVPWTDRGGILTSAPSASARYSGHVDVFARGGNLAIYHLYKGNAGWQGWYSRGGSLSSAPAAASWNSKRTDLFALGQNRDLYQKIWTPGGWYSWQNIED